MKTGFVALVGRPNAGKSTLLNTIMQQKLAIISNKPQTSGEPDSSPLFAFINSA